MSVQRGPPRYVLSIINRTVLQLQDKTVLGVHIVTPSVRVLQGWKPKQGMSTPSPATCHFTRHFKLFHPESHGFEATKHLGVFCRFFGSGGKTNKTADSIDRRYGPWKLIWLQEASPTSQQTNNDFSLGTKIEVNLAPLTTMFWKGSRPSFINQLAKETWHI